MSQSTQTPRQQRGTNGQQQRPHKDLDLYQEAVNPSLTDGFLDDNNLGLGNLDEGEVYQQIESFRAGMFAEAALVDRLDDRRIEETKRALALEGCDFELTNDQGQVVKKLDFAGWRDDDDNDALDEDDRRRYLEAKGDYIWGRLPEDARYQAIIEHTGVSEWMPPHQRMMLARNEASKSKGARTQDNLFGRVKKFIEGGGSSGSSSARKRIKNLTSRNGGGSR